MWNTTGTRRAITVLFGVTAAVYLEVCERRGEAVEASHDGVEGGPSSSLSEVELIEPLGRQSDRRIQTFVHRLDVRGEAINLCLQGEQLGILVLVVSCHG